MPRWIEPTETPIPTDLQQAVGGNPLVAQILVRRGFTDPAAALAFLNPARYSPASPHDLPDMGVAVQRILTAIQRQERVLVWGDFDVDGQTSTALLVSMLRSLGLSPSFHIPVRARESHGVNIANLAPRIDAGLDLILTCDTGVTAHEALDYARQRGVEVIVTDHHALGETLPPALAIITPRRLPADHPLRGLPGVGAAYKLAEALFAQAGRPDEVTELLDLAALGIVADVAAQVDDTRYLLQRGLERLRSPRRVGLTALMELAGVDPTHLTEEHIGFSLGPRLNALGRLSDANPAVELLTTSDAERASVLALTLEELNTRRQLLTSQVLQAAESQLKRDPGLLASPVLVLAHPEWPGGVIGIAASALVGRYQKPAILFNAPPGGVARGSARSVEGVDITACIASAARAGALLHGYGGHPMAAGLSLDTASLPAFRRAIATAVQQAIEASGGPVEPALQLEARLSLAEVNLDLAEELERLAPFGAGNPAPLFLLPGLSIASAVEIGKNKEHRAVTLSDQAGAVQKALWWGGADQPLPEGRFDLACAIRASNFRGQRDVQVAWIAARLCPEEAIEVAAIGRSVLDYRAAANPRKLLANLRKEGELTIWAEGVGAEPLKASSRLELPPAARLAIWTAPPGRAELMAALERVQPRQVILFGLAPQEATPQAFLARLSGLVKYLLAHPDGQPAPLERLAAAAIQRTSAVYLGLHWLAARGNITLAPAEGSAGLMISPGPGRPQDDPTSWLTQLQAVLDETAAYRRFFTSANPTELGIL